MDKLHPASARSDLPSPAKNSTRDEGVCVTDQVRPAEFNQGTNCSSGAGRAM
jgi:hypothetical protein